MPCKISYYGQIPRLPLPVQKLVSQSFSDTKRAYISSADYSTTSSAIGYAQRNPIVRDQSLQQLSSGSENVSSSYQANKALLACDSLEIRDESSPSKVSGNGAPLRPWKNLVKYSEERKQHKRVINQILKDKGDLSFDWRIPLRALEEYHDLEDKAGKTFNSSWTTSSVARPRTHQKHVNQIKPQPSWSASTLMDYIHDLTTSSVDKSAKYHIYGAEGSQVMSVSYALENLFKEAPKELLSTTACHTALRFFFKHNQISKARAVFSRMEHLHQGIQTPTINILLLAAANQKDLHNFTIMLKWMLRWEFKPDVGTWYAFLVAIESREVQEVIIQSMRERNLLRSPLVVKKVVSTIIRDDVIKHLSSDQSLDSFLSSLDKRYGMKWLSVDAANKLLHEVGKRKGVYETISLLDNLKRRGLMADRVTLATMLQTCRYYNHHFMVPRLLVLFEKEYLVVPGQDAYNTLFGIAWSRRWYNFLRVIWRFACVKGYSSRYMCQLILRSIRSEDETPPPGKRKNNNKIWKNSAGAVAVGIEPHTLSQQNPQIQSTALLNARQTDFEYNDTNGLAIRERVERMYKKDLATVGRYQIVESLAELLVNAHLLDCEWHSSGAWKAQSTEWKHENAITPTLTQNQEKPASWRYVFLAEKAI